MNATNYKPLLLGVILAVIGASGLLATTLLRPSVNMDAAESVAKSYLNQFGSSDIAVDEIIEFEQNYYVVYIERSTGIGAFEMLIDKQTGSIFPEYGPNMMWNLKYGHGGMMGRWRTTPSSQMPVTSLQAKAIAQDYLNSAYTSAQAEEVHTFYGYYTIHTIKDGKTSGMLSVNGYDGTIWYHSRHGYYIQSREIGKS